MRYLMLKDIIENIYKSQDLGSPEDLDRAVDNILHKPDLDNKNGILFPSKENELSIPEYSSIRNAGAANPHSHFPRKPFKRVMNTILKNGNDWIKEYVVYLKKKIDYPIISMNRPLIEYIDETINNPLIDMPIHLRTYLRNPNLAYDCKDKNDIHWIRLAWLIILSVLQSDLIVELSSLWCLPDEYTLARTISAPFNIAVFSSNAFSREILDVTIDEDEVINIYANFTPHRDVERTPEWASLVCWIPYAPLDYSNYSGAIIFNIRAISGISKISVELQNVENTGGHKYFMPFTIDRNWKTVREELSKRTVSPFILKTFGAICFVIHPEDFCGTEMQGHIQISNIKIE